MENFNPLLPSNPNAYQSGFIPPLQPEIYQNPLIQQNEPNPPPIPNNPPENQEILKNENDIQPAGFDNPAAEMPAHEENAAADNDPMKPKHKRRSKNEQDGRDYECGCGKTYLSYPALYTHIKTKHDGKIPTGTPPLPSGRGRGRPRKVFFL